GFFYYYTPPKAPPLVGEIRFRCASSLDDFHEAKDLLSKDRFTPWSISLHDVANHSARTNLRKQLMHDDLVSQTTLEKWDKKAIHLHLRSLCVGSQHPVLYYLCQPFVIRPGRQSALFFTATKDEIGSCVLDMWFVRGGDGLSRPPSKLQYDSRL
ncbi:hypothetical protein F5887DRAFT_875969, partial [Amanita rubescens]